MFKEPFDYALATKVTLICLMLFLILTGAYLAMTPLQVESSSPSATETIKKVHVVSLYQYIKQRPVQQTYESAIWDAFTLASPSQREQLDRAFPEQAVVFRGYSIAEDKDKWFTNEGIIIMQVFTEPLSSAPPSPTSQIKF